MLSWIATRSWLGCSHADRMVWQGLRHRQHTLLENLDKPGHGIVRIGAQAKVRPGVMGGNQLGFTDEEQSTAKKQTKREKVLAEM